MVKISNVETELKSTIADESELSYVIENAPIF